MKRFIISLVLFATFLAMPMAISFAQTPAPAPTTNWENYVPQEAKTVGTIDVASKRIINILLLVAGAVAVIYIIIGGYQYVTAGGNADTASQARSTILNALIGLIIIFAAYAIVAFVLKKFIG